MTRRPDRREAETLRAGSRSRAPLPSWAIRISTAWPVWSTALAVAALTFFAFLGVLHNGFLNWDDEPVLTSNPYYRGVSPSHLLWMATTLHMGHYMPVTWLSFALDYIVWSMDPLGYHLTNLLLHAVNAVLVLLIARRLLHAASPSGDSNGLLLGSAVAALFFSIHPLRVESVAWATERKDVLSGLFYLLAVLAYLRASQPGRTNGSLAPRWYLCSLGFFALALLSKAMAITLPVTLLILDVYPLRRLRPQPAGWIRGVGRNVLREKLPYLALSLSSAGAAVIAVAHGATFTPTATLSWMQRLAVSCYGLAFYLWKTVVPVGLSPLYELPDRVNPWGWSFLVSGIAVVAITVAVVLLRRRTGAPLAVWTAYVVAITPVLGLVLHNGDQIAADRYTYLPCVGWALLIGGGLTMTWRRSFSGGAWARAGVLGLATVTLALLAVLTWHQVGNWRDTQTLWTHALSVQPSGIAHTYVGLALEWDQQRDAALLHYREAVRRRPSSPTIQYMVGLGLERLGHAREAIGHYREAVRLRPQMADARGSLGLALAQAGETDEAEGQFREALRLDPRSAEIRNSYGVALGRMGQIDRANEQFREALRIDPGNREARAALSAAEAAERGRTGAKP